MSNVEHETGFIDVFVTPAKRSRYRALLANPKRRKVILERLNHCFDFVANRAQKTDVTLDALESLLRSHGAGDFAYVISDSKELDGHILPLRKALDGVAFYSFGSIISCIPGELAYFKSEAPGDCYILRLQR